jgi:MFS transporter, ACS family, tartrate transporter
MSSDVTISAPPAVAVGQDDTDLARETIRRVSVRLLPFLFFLFICNWMDRENVGIAALQMNRDLRFSASAYGLGAGILFIGYALFEVPSNLILARVGARRWIARIMITWGLIASAMMCVRTPLQFYVLRFALGVAEAGFFPGIIYYLSLWFPAPQRARATARFMIAVPLAATIGNPLGGWLLGLDGSFGLHGWQWVFLIEGIPSVLLGVGVLALLTDDPRQAGWLSGEQRDWLAARLERDGEESAAPHGLPPLRALLHPIVWRLALLYFLLLMSSYSYGFWAPIVIRDALHSSNLATGFITGGMGCLAAIGMLAVGASSDRNGEHCLHVGAAAVLIALGLVGAALLPGAIARVAALALVSVGVRGFLPAFWCLPSMFLRGSAAAAGIALINSFGNLGGFVGPYVVGIVKDATGSATDAFLVFAAFALAAGGLSLMLRRHAVFAVRGEVKTTTFGAATVG